MLYSPQHNLCPEKETENKIGKRGMKADRDFFEYSSSLNLKYDIRLITDIQKQV